MTSWPEFVQIAQKIRAYAQDYEEMTPNSEGGRHIWKDWEHYRRSYVLPERAGIAERATVPAFSSRWYRGEYPDILGHLGQSCYSSTVGKFNSDLLAYYVKRIDGGFVPLPSDLESMKQAALTSLLPLIKSELSLVNSVIELKDFRTVGRSIQGVSNLAKRFVRPASAGGTLRELLGVTADAWLQTSFNIRPLLSDIRGVKTALSRTMRKLNDLVTRQGRVQTRHCQFVLTDEQDSTFTDIVRTVSVAEGGHSNPNRCYSQNNNLQTKFQVRRYTTVEPAILHFELEYNYNYLSYHAERARILAYLDALGVNLNPAIVWNAIPWSFVVDWVFGVSRWLDQFKRSNLQPVINIRRGLWSIKRGRRILVTAKSITGSLYDQWPETPGGVVYERAYRRSTWMPTSSSIVSSGLNPKEFSLGAALVVAQRRYSRNRMR